MGLLKFIKEDKIGEYFENISLKDYNTYKIGGIAKLIVFPKNRDMLIELLTYVRNNDVKYKIIGNGSNLIFSDQNYNGVIIKLDRFDKLHISKTTVIVESGYSLMKLAQKTMRMGLTGLEFASGIPGTVGGAVIMNAGAYKSDMSYIIKEVEVLTPDLEIKTLSNEELDYNYRTSFLKKNPEYICLSAVIELKHGDKSAIKELNEDRKRRRLESQPLEYPSAGSVFRNPLDLFAGKLIEDCELKGKIIGGAQISEKHANFIINIGGATASDVKELIDLVKKTVFDKYQVELKEEQEYVNWE